MRMKKIGRCSNAQNADVAMWASLAILFMAMFR